ncbi:hypothetical protein H0H92_012651 [Tricholoma furcatifolium]|nr:hypothetical protein H0H92_012651 [Tricholoma furcatifolium]
MHCGWKALDSTVDDNTLSRMAIPDTPNDPDVPTGAEAPNTPNINNNTPTPLQFPPRTAVINTTGGNESVLSLLLQPITEGDRTLAMSPQTSPPPATLVPMTPEESPSKQRIRITRKNPIFESVNGAMRGNMKLDIPRGKPLRSAITSVSDNTRRYNRVVEDIIVRSERLSEETNCWFLLLSQLPTSKGLIHFSSSRLRREAKDDVTRIVNEFQLVTRSLLAAKRDEAAAILKRYDESQSQLDKVNMELAEKNAELERYRAMYGNVE